MKKFDFKSFDYESFVGPACQVQYQSETIEHVSWEDLLSKENQILIDIRQKASIQYS